MYGVPVGAVFVINSKDLPVRMDELWLAPTRRVSWLDKAHAPGLHGAD